MFPPGLHLSHRYVNTIGWSPVQVPGPAVSSWPLSGVVSEIVGRAVFTGATRAVEGLLGAAYATATNTAATATAKTANRPRRVGVVLCIGLPCLGNWAVVRSPVVDMRSTIYESLTAERFATLASL